jgi:hypothetical protein
MSFLLESDPFSTTGDVRRGERILDPSGDGTSPALDILTTEAQGVPGGPYDFKADDGDWWETFTKLRDNLNDKAGIVTRGGNTYAHTKEWALVSDQYIFAETLSTSSGRNIRHYDIGLAGSNAPGWIYKDVSYVTKDTATRVRTSLTFILSDNAQGGAIRFYVTNPEFGGTATLSRKRGVSGAEIDNIAISSRVSNYAAGQPGYVVGGRTDLFQVSRTSWDRFGATEGLFTVYLNYIPGAPVALDCPVDVTVSIPGRTVIGQNRAYSLIFDVERTILPDRVAQVISPRGSDWYYIKAAEIEVRRNEVHQSAPPDVAAGNAAIAAYSAIVESWVLPQYDQTGHWRVRQFPPYKVEYESFGSEFELAKYQAGDRPDTGTLVPRAGTLKPRANIVTQSVAVSHYQANLFQSRRQQARAWLPHGTDYEGRSSGWANAVTLDATVPAAVTGTGNFSLPAIRLADAPFGVSLFAENTNCPYYRIPLGITGQEIETLGGWHRLGIPTGFTTRNALTDTYPDRAYRLFDDRGVGVNLNRTNWGSAGSTAGPHYAHNARLTSIDGGTFWWQDVVYDHPEDLEHIQHRYRHWFINLESGQLYLYLLLDRKSILYSAEGGGQYKYVQYFPEEPITVEMYQNAFQRFRKAHLGNALEYNPPWHSKVDAPVGPVPFWTIGKISGPAWTAGQQLRIQLPRRTSATQAFGWARRERHAVDVTNAGVEYLQEWDSQPERRTQLAGLVIQRSPHRTQVLTIRNGGAVLAETPLHLRVYQATQVDSGIDDDGYDATYPADYHNIRYDKGRELSSGEFTVSGTAISIRGASDYSVYLACYQTRRNCPEIEIEVGNADENGTFTAYDTFTIEASTADGNPEEHEVQYPFHRPEALRIVARWIFDRLWPIAYKRVLNDVACPLSATPATFGSTAGNIYTATVDQDATARATVVWAMEDGTEQTTATDFLLSRGANTIPPRAEFTDGRIGWTKTITATRCIQRFGVFVRHSEIFSNPLSNSSPFFRWPPLGVPLALFFNETRRLLAAYKANP